MIHFENRKCDSEAPDPEGKLLLCCVNHTVDRLGLSVLSKDYWEKSCFDWDKFFYLSWANKVIPLVWSELKMITTPQIPERISDTFQCAYDQIIGHHLKYIYELKNLVQLLGANNIPVIPFKGPTLGRFYSHASERQWGDLDIIIQKKDIYHVVDLLRSKGYLDSIQPSTMSLEKLLEKNHAYYVNNSDGTVQIDIHWRLVEESDEIQLPMASIWDHSVDSHIFNVKSRMLSPEYMLITTCIHHGARNGWEELRLINDFARLIQAFPDLNWQFVLDTSQKLGFLRTLLVGLLLANTIFSAAIPAIFVKNITYDKQVPKLQAVILKQLFVRHGIKRRLIIFGVRVRIRENMKTRIVMSWHLAIEIMGILLKPNDQDKRSISLPPSMLFVLYFTRPFRLIRKFIFKLGI